ncbi:hypothetical protein DEO72_LG4g1416 [Vigna unguiculata]|uniref:Uncharacterized protein n=1 Tax=Vigna unguiculata TaxID=3917 RepID=A0A4D6LPM3_VIGUN|nr:hypothetical protein DEO72_LG4g1416 [Vigna unguiculata]
MLETIDDKRETRRRKKGSSAGEENRRGRTGGCGCCRCYGENMEDLRQARALVLEHLDEVTPPVATESGRE